MATPVAKTYDWKQALRTHGLRATPSTLATLQCLEHASQAMSHDDLTQQLGGQAPDRVTLYRILERLMPGQYCPALYRLGKNSAFRSDSTGYRRTF